MMVAELEPREDDKSRAEFEQVMNFVTERAWADRREEDVMAALFDVLNGPLPDTEETAS